jgi:predicted PurR-regulated permease PerM
MLPFVKKSEDSTLPSVFYISVLAIIFFYILNIGASLIIPFIIAVLFSFAIIALSNVFKKIHIPSFLSFILSMGVYIGIIWLF